MLKDCNLDLVEIGHSERRTHFGETDRTVGLKVKAAIAHGLLPLICIGETLAEREAGRADAILSGQVEGAFQFLDDDAKSAGILIAYEPVWSIGERGIPATADYVGEQHAKIRQWCAAVLPKSPPVLYGGSVKPGNARELMSQADIDGALVGGASLEARSFVQIVNAALLVAFHVVEVHEPTDEER